MRIGMIGAGFIAKLNGEAIMATPGVDLCAIANRTTRNAENLAAELGSECPIYADYQEMLEKEKPDAVLINLAHHLHHKCFLDCAAAGTDIIIEKALANSYAECLEMIAAAKHAGIKATVFHTQRYNAIYMAATQFIEEHSLGRLLSVSDNINTHYFREGRSAWQLSQAESGGGIALNYGVHQLDRVHYFLNQKTVAFSAKYLAEKEGFEIFSSYAMMGVGDGGTPYVITGTGYSGPWVNETRLVFEKGVLQCNLFDNGMLERGLWFGSNDDPAFQRIPVPLNDEDIYKRELRAAVDYLGGDAKEPPVPLEWAAEMVRLVEKGGEGGDL